MSQCKFAYVILHYNTVKDTEECVASIRENACGSYKIIVVDNCSPNGSGAVIEKEYKDAEDVHVILNTVNEGFARGNNRGFIYAKKQWGAEFIVLMNNDTMLISCDFQQKVEEEYAGSKCGVVGPLIHTPDNQYIATPSNRPSLIHEIYEQLKQYIYWGLSYCRDMDIKVHKIYKAVNPRSNTDNTERRENVILNGCCWIFTPEYISRFDGLNDKTFLYYEENILYLRCLKAGLKTVYLPTIEIYHKEDAATNSLNFQTDRNKRRFIYKYVTQSKWVMIREMLNRK